MNRLHRGLVIAAVLMVVHIVVPVAAAHPLGNFTINHYAGLSVGPQSIAIDYILDMAEIPAFQEIATFDTSRNGQPDTSETAGYHPGQCEAIRSQLALRLDGRPLPLTLASSAVEFPPGAGGLLTLRLTCAFVAAISPAGKTARVEFEDQAYAERLGWREIVVTGDGVWLEGEIASASISQRLRVYPDDLLTSPLDQRGVAFTLTPVGPESLPAGGPLTTSSEQADPLIRARSDAFTQLITLQTLNPSVVLFALAVSVMWGAMHAMTPGHGKTLVGAYLVGSRGTAWQAVFLGLATTVTHTAGVFALGLVTLFASGFIVPERLYPWLSLVSGLLVVAIGLNLAISRLRGAVHHQSDHPHDAHSHDHAHGHPHDAHHDQTRLPAGRTRDRHPPTLAATPIQTVTWRSLLGLGVSGGLLPCPSALVVLLSAIALGRIGFGLALVLAFSVGLAGTLTAIGLALVYAGRLFERLARPGRLIRLLPAASALFVTLMGLAVTVQALVSILS
jgi:nickel/cobalt transporter (NicO) family protein